MISAKSDFYSGKSLLFACSQKDFATLFLYVHPVKPLENGWHQSPYSCEETKSCQLLTSQKNDWWNGARLDIGQPTLRLLSSLFPFCPWQRIISGIQKPNVPTSEVHEEKHLTHYIWSLWHYWNQSRSWIFFPPGLISSKTFYLFSNWIKSDICFLIFYTSIFHSY